MAALSSSALLLLWEEVVQEHPLERPLAILRALSPDDDADDLRALSVGRRDGALLALREAAFGHEVSGVVECESCGQELELSFDTRELGRPPAGAGDGVHALTRSGRRIRFRLPTSDDLAAAAVRPGLEEARHELLQRCILRPPLAELDDEERKRVVERMAELDPLADVSIELTCPECGAIAVACFDVASFLWAELDSAARRTLEDVHALASAYGWREEDVLGLTPMRRRLYLELAG